MKRVSFNYHEGKNKKTILVKPCRTFFSKLSGLMFRKKSSPLLFIFEKEKNLSIHSFFCKPFTAIWLDDKKRVTKKENVKPWRFYISGQGKYLLEIPIIN